MTLPILFFLSIFIILCVRGVGMQFLNIKLNYLCSTFRSIIKFRFLGVCTLLFMCSFGQVDFPFPPYQHHRNRFLSPKDTLQIFLYTTGLFITLNCSIIARTKKQK